jgi:hypothetical protein
MVTSQPSTKWKENTSRDIFVYERKSKGDKEMNVQRVK